MNRLQRAILIGVGLTIACVQLIGIAERGLDENRGWAISLLIAAVLLFVGSGTSFDWLNRKRDTRATEPIAPPPPVPIPAPTVRPTPTTAKATKPGKYDFGVHISELDIAIEAHKNYAEHYKLDVSVQGNARSLNWNCCISVYASMRLAALKAQMRVHSGVWNTIVRGVVIRMSTNETEGIGMGDPGFKELESDAYAEVERANQAVDEALSGEGGFLVQPITRLLSQNFGTRTEDGMKALSAMIIINAEAAHKKILPELLADLT